MIVDLIKPIGEMFTINLRHPDDKKIYVGWAIVEYVANNGGIDELKVWDIFVRPKYRRMGYGTELINFLKNEKDVKIWTNYEKISDDGAQLFLRAGFKIYKSTVKKEANKLVWINGTK